MMRKRDLEQLERVAEVVFLEQSGRLEALQARENGLRREIDKIRERQEAASGREGLFAMRHPELHAAWNLWCSRAISELSDGLDRLQFEKAELHAQVRESFGRHLAVRHLVREHLGQGRKRRPRGCR